ncbi:unnamed protein product [Brassicogethes aeneus]|uniref:Uncharacterized protein n=1 Tax=Brassicogethes aeneus TaxID=1431903 RepID=A0A9P0AZW2_BRAAE|nr:unnamed protein product [Brassicogethes aeneus]
MNISTKVKRILIPPKFINNVIQCSISRSYVQYTVSEKTLTGRIISYLNPNKEESNVADSTKLLQTIQYNPQYILKDAKLQDLHKWIKLIPKKQNLFQLINKECTKRIHSMNNQEICNLLHSFVKVFPSQIAKTEFYNASMDILFQNVNSLGKNELVQLIFFAGLQKKTKRSQIILKGSLRCLDPYLDELDVHQLCIICNSFFKTSTKLSPKVLNLTKKFISNNLEVLKDPALFVAFIKVLRQNKDQTEELLTNISCAIFFNKTLQLYSFTAICHILALYSDFLYYDEKLFEHFVRLGLDQISNEPKKIKAYDNMDTVRNKDINRFIWSLANVNYQNLTQDHIETIIVKKIFQRIDKGDFLGSPDLLIEMLLSLWILNYRSYDMLSYVLTQTNIIKIRESASPVKQRLNLLLSCIYLEDPKLFQNLNLDPSMFTTYKADLQIKKRQDLQRVFNCLNLIAKTHEINRFELVSQVPHLNIVGIAGYKKKIYKMLHVEVLDDHTSVKNTDSLPIGLMELKLRLLDKTEEGLVIVDSKEICDMTEHELQLHLVESINLVT